MSNSRTWQALDHLFRRKWKRMLTLLWKEYDRQDDLRWTNICVLLHRRNMRRDPPNETDSLSAFRNDHMGAQDCWSEWAWIAECASRQRVDERVRHPVVRAGHFPATVHSRSIQSLSLSVTATEYPAAAWLTAAASRSPETRSIGASRIGCSMSNICVSRLRMAMCCSPCSCKL
jgi:hypothetical protein